jgi:translation initiation factor IF-1
MNSRKIAVFAALLSLTSTVWAQEAEMERPSMSSSRTMMVSAVVEAINHETREVTVRRTDDTTLTFTASEEARNLDQVSVGDVLKAEYVESLSIEVFANEGMEPDAAAATAVARTKEGQMPGFAAMEQTVITATIEEINIEANTFKLKEADGSVNEYTARVPSNLKRVKVGDLVVITVTGAIAIVVEEVPAE